MHFGFGLRMHFGFGFGIIQSFGFGRNFGPKSVSAQTKPKFRYFGFGLNSGFGRSLVEKEKEKISKNFLCSSLPSLNVHQHFIIAMTMLNYNFQ